MSTEPTCKFVQLDWRGLAVARRCAKTWCPCSDAICFLLALYANSVRRSDLDDHELAARVLLNHFTATATLIALMLKWTFPFRVAAEP
jgi:hypothetical protein